eukprot:4837958-Amphidinium_carterae.2
MSMLRATGIVVPSIMMRGIGAAPTVATVDLAGFTVKSMLCRSSAMKETEDWSNSADEATSTKSSA